MIIIGIIGTRGMHSWFMPYIAALSFDHLNFALHSAYMPFPPPFLDIFWGGASKENIAPSQKRGCSLVKGLSPRLMRV